MPFQLTLVAPNWGDSQTPMLISWHIQQKALFQKGDALFSLTSRDRKRIFHSNMPGYFSEFLVKEGSYVQPGQSVAIVGVDGEDIPYGRSYIYEK